MDGDLDSKPAVKQNRRGNDWRGIENGVGEAAGIGFGRGVRGRCGFAYGIKKKKIEVVVEKEKLVRVPREVGNWRQG